MSQLSLRVFHLKHIFRTAVSVNVHFKVRMRLKNALLLMPFIFCFDFSPILRKLFAALCQAQMAASQISDSVDDNNRP